MVTIFSRWIPLVIVCLLHGPSCSYASDTAGGGGPAIPAPTPISNYVIVTPAYGPVAGGTAVTLTGTGFTTGSTVTFDTTAATNVVVVSKTEITCTTPAHASGTVTVTVSSASAGAAAKTGSFTYVGQPTITSVTPAIGSYQTQVVITGTNFGDGIGGILPPVVIPLPPVVIPLPPIVIPQNSGSLTTTTLPLPIGVVTVTFGTAGAIIQGPISATALTCYAPLNPPGPVDVTVTNVLGQSATAAGAFTYEPAPTVGNVTPSSGPLSGGTNVTITGASFTGTQVGVTFGGTAATDVAVVSDTNLTCTTPGILVASPLGTIQAGATASAITLPDEPVTPILPILPIGKTPISIPVTVAVTVDGATGYLAGAFTYLTIAGTDTNSPPVFVSPPAANPDPATAGQPVLFTAVASDPADDYLIYTWNFGDGSTVLPPLPITPCGGNATGSNGGAIHVYTTPGTYTATVTVTNGFASVSQSLTVTVLPTEFAITAGNIFFNFNAKNTSGNSLTLTGILPLPTGFTPANSTVTVAVGAYATTLTLNASGRATDGKTAFFALLRGQRFAFEVMHTALFATLEPLGFVNSNVPPPGVTVNVPVTLTLGGTSNTTTQAMTYTAQQGRSGRAVLKAAPKVSAEQK